MRPYHAFAFLLIALTIPCFPAPAQVPGELPPLYAAAADADLGADVAARLAALADAPVPADAELAVLFEHRAMQLGMEGLDQRLDGAVVLLPPHAGGLEHRVPLPWKAEVNEASAWIRRADGTVTRLADADIARESAPLSGSPVLVVAVPDAAPGDVVGWSAAFTSQGISVRALHPSREHFVAESTYRLITPDVVSYGMVIERPTPGDIVQTLASAKGRPNDQAALFRNLPPLGETPFGRPDALQPVLNVTALGNYVEQMGKWFVIETWQPFAQFVDGAVQAFTTDAPVTASVARQAVKDDDTDRIKLLKLQRLVSRQIATIPTTDFGDPAERADEVLEREAATARAKCLLLLSMARQIGLDVDLVLARDHRLGPLDDARPTLAQFTDTLVRLKGDEPLYLTHDDRYPADALPFHLLGAPAASAAPGALETVQRAFMDMAMNNKPAPDFGAEPPLTLFRLPGDPAAAPLSSLTESVVWDDAGGAAVNLEAVGESDLFLDHRGRTPAAELMRRHLAAAFPALALEPGETAAGRPKSAATAMHVVVRGPASGDAGVPAAQGDAWTLPAAAVFGAPTAAGWPAGPGAPYHAFGEVATVRTWSHPLPAGWKTVRLPAPLELRNDVLVYRAEVTAADGVLTVTRTATFRPGHLEGDRTGPLRALLEKVRDFESAPLRLEKE